MPPKQLLVSQMKQDKKGDYHLHIKAKPGSKKEGIELDASGENILVRVRAPAVDGKANEAIIALLAKTLKIPKRHIHLVRGETASLKDFRIEDLPAL